ncbi:3-deoxy-D-manno-octulosonic acid transferase [Georgfuchsia toluolica]|uniref:3-deoxy-D-manno-octulosonic acid transferase n=1 Tax=Georgfuchsia toluolica TaxID=424218 RepID=A0A916J673_9PROT|nr:lipid IV(A) 3-deoxy-D-manno-octulosonic acid transferase [Georgfuchsia toluolica]CAG4884701.1 3-deoxy-D-manno-octulosonic acid transferase [Georgfuchsia toluolica]
MTRRLYTLLLWLLLPWALLHLLWRSRRQTEYLRHWDERFAHYTRPANRPVIWIHAVSVGETRAAQPLIKALREKYPAHRILLTQTTPTGRQTGIELFGDTVERIYLAYDFPGTVKRFLDHWRPEFGLIMETELWPNVIAECKARRVPLMLVNGRLSEKSARRYACFAALTHEALNNLAGVAAQTDSDARRLAALGAQNVAVLGNLKFDIMPPPGQLELGASFRQMIGTRCVLLCASTREGEEALILDAWMRSPLPDVLLVIVPRHPQRVEDVAGLVGMHRLKLQRRSSDHGIEADTQVWLGDSMGEMFAYYAACDVAFVGGSLIDHGGQNLIEPCAVGRPVLIGPSTFNFARAADDAVAARACRRVGNADEMIAAAATLLENTQLRKQMEQNALAFAGAHRGATARTMEWIATILQGNHPR